MTDKQWIEIFYIVTGIIEIIVVWDIMVNTEMQDTSGKDLEIMKKLRKK